MRSLLWLTMLARLTQALPEAPHLTKATAEAPTVRNIAIIANVDHGKTTLVNSLLQVGTDIAAKEEIGRDHRLMDSNDQERERGIKHLPKNCAIEYKGTKINIVDTPGHVDFGGEIEGVFNMVDDVLFLVDACEGPKPQTRFVLKKAIERKLNILVVINKIDKPAARPAYVLDQTFDLLRELGASDDQTNFPVVYASAINRIAGSEPDADMVDMTSLFDKILEMPKPVYDPEGPLQLQISSVASGNSLGRLGIGRITSGSLTTNEQVGLSAGPGEAVKPVKVSELFNFDAMGISTVEAAKAGDIVVFSGIDAFKIGDTVVSPDNPQPLEPLAVEPPTMSITFGVNKAPLAGQDGKLLTSCQIKDRLYKELETNVALKVELTEDIDTFLVSGRGLLHLTVLMESMRREGFELMIGRPKVIETEVEGQRHEPYELVHLELPEEYLGPAMHLLKERKGEIKKMATPSQEGLVTLQYVVPSRGINGLKPRLLSVTRGLVVMTTAFIGYKPFAGEFGGRDRGNLISQVTGTASTYSLVTAQQRGIMFAKPGDEVYENQIIGIHSYDNDLKVNICETKQLTNIRAAGSDDNAKIVPAKEMTIEESVEYIVKGEYVELTPHFIRMGVREKVV